MIKSTYIFIKSLTNGRILNCFKTEYKEIFVTLQFIEPGKIKNNRQTYLTGSAILIFKNEYAIKKKCVILRKENWRRGHFEFDIIARKCGS